MATVTETSIEQRLAAAEAAIAEIRGQLPAPSKYGWLQDVIGSMRDEPAFAEVIALGRAFRQADRPAGDDPS